MESHGLRCRIRRMGSSRLWLTVEDLHRQYVLFAAAILGVLGLAQGVTAIVRSDPKLGLVSAALLCLTGVAAWQLASNHLRLDRLAGAAGALILAASFVRPLVVMIGSLLAYTAFVSAAAYLKKSWWSVWSGIAIVISGAETMLRMGGPSYVLALGIFILIIGSGIGGLMHRHMAILLRADAARWDSLFVSAPDGIVVARPDGSVLAVNGRFREMFGLRSAEEAVGEFVEKFLSPGEMGPPDQLYGVRVDGETFPIDVTFADVQFEHGEVVQAIVRDVSERVEHERRLKQMSDSRLELLASVSHEVRTPLTAIVGFSELLKENDDMSTDQREAMIRDIAAEAAGMTNLVEDLLVGARAELGELEVVSVPVNLRSQTRQVLESLQMKEVPVETVGSDTVHADPGRVRQILRNLIANAETHGGKNLRIDIAGSFDTVSVAVSDEGPSLSEREQQEIFEPFKVGPAHGGRPGPIGIGLTLSKDLAQKMGGDLTYRHDGKRTIFELILPAVTSEPGNASPGVRESNSP